jgi:hypothetical protein
MKQNTGKLVHCSTLVSKNGQHSRQASAPEAYLFRNFLLPSWAISLHDVLTPDACDGLSSHRDTTRRGTSPPLSIIDIDADEDETMPEPIEDLHVPRNDPLRDRLLSSDLPD